MPGNKPQFELKIEYFHVFQGKKSEIYQKTSQNHTHHRPKKSKKWPVIRSDLREKIDFVVAWV